MGKRSRPEGALTTPRAPRVPARVARVHTRPIPTQAARLRRGPTPPDLVIAVLQRHLPGPDAHSPVLGAGWAAALALAAAGVARHARRGVTMAVGAAALPVGTVAAPLPAGWLERVTALVQADLARLHTDWLQAASILAAQARVESELLQEHARQVRHFAQAAGTRGYIWTTMQDELVRPLHVELEGTAHRWTEPPVSGTDGFRGHPGVPARCRCVAFPLLGRI